MPITLAMNTAILPRPTGAFTIALLAALLPVSADAQSSASQSSTVSVNGQSAVRTSGSSTGGAFFVSDDNRPEWMSAAKLNLVISGGNIVEDGKKIGPATVAGVLEYVGKKEPNFSYILSPGVGNVEVADMVLHNVRVTDFSQALLQATDTPLNATFSRSSGNSPAILKVSGPSTQRVVEAFNLSNYLGSRAEPDAVGESHPALVLARNKLESLKELILKTVRDVDDKQSTLSKSLSFEFHEGAGVLVVIGQERAIEIARRVINALQPQGARNRPVNAYPQRPSEIDALLSRLVEIDGNLDAGSLNLSDPDQRLEIERAFKLLNDLQLRTQPNPRTFQQPPANPFRAPPDNPAPRLPDSRPGAADERR